MLLVLLIAIVTVSVLISELPTGHPQSVPAPVQQVVEHELKKLRISRISAFKLNMPDLTSATTTNTFLLVWIIAVLLDRLPFPI